MKAASKYSAVGVLLQTVGMFSLAGTAAATPIDATVEVASGSGYSVVHWGDNPGGTGDSMQWLWFDSSQALSLDLTAGIVTLDGGSQSFSLTSGYGATGTLEITGLNLDLNDVSDGFAGGTLDYVLNGSTTGQFNFLNQNYNSIFNSSNFDGTNLDFTIWGGDGQNELGIDFGVSGVISPVDPDPVPVPGTLALAALGLLGLARTTRRRKDAV